MTDIDATSGRPVSTTGLHVLYALHAVSPFTLWSLSFLAVIMGAFMRDSARGTYLESHYSWLLRTFCWTILWAVILVVPTILMALTILLIPVAYFIWLVLGAWYLYRVIRGWLRLNEGQPAP